MPAPPARAAEATAPGSGDGSRLWRGPGWFENVACAGGFRGANRGT